MRIGLIAPPWIPVPPPGYGGLEVVVGDLARGLAQRGHDVQLFTVGTSTSPVTRQHLFVQPAEPMGQAVPEAAHVLAAYEALADVDVIHDHTVLGPLIAGREGMSTPPVVTTNHGPFTSITIPIFREIARTAAVVAISADQARRATGIPIAAVIHHGVDLDAYSFGPGGDQALVFIGRMSPEKGVDDAVRIARAAARPLRILTKIREPTELEYYESQVRPLLGADVDVCQEPSLKERREILATAAGLVKPIAWPEPFGLVMAESLAVGTPVIAFPRGAAPEIITDGRTGFLPSSVAAAASLVPHLAEIDRRTCRSEAERRFSMQRMAADHERLYERLARHGRTARVLTRPRVERSAPGWAAGLPRSLAAVVMNPGRRTLCLSVRSGRPVMKLSAGKATAPGAKQVYRSWEEQGDLLSLDSESAPPRPFEPLLETVMTGGRRTAAAADLGSAHELVTTGLRRLPLPVLALRGPESRQVTWSAALRELTRRLTEEYRPTTGLGWPPPSEEAR